MRKTLTVLATTAVLSLGLVACGDDDAVSEEDRDRAASAAVEAAGGGTALSVDRGDDDDLFEYEVEVEREGGDQVDVRLDEDFEVVGDVPQASPSAAAPSEDPSASASASASPSVGNDDDDDRQLTGDTLEQASAAAIEAAGGEGRVTDAERSDDRDHAYDVEVRLPNGEDVDVDLDEQFGVVRVDR